MAGDDAEKMKSRRGYTPGRIVLGLFLGLIAGWIIWEWVADALEVQPLYRLRDLGDKSTRPICIGPWLVFHESVDRERLIASFRRLSDGHLEHRTERTLNDYTNYIYAINHPQLGSDTLIGTSRSLLTTNWSVVLFQPRTGEERVIHSWNRTEASVQLSSNGKFFIKTLVLPLTPIFALALNGFPDVVNMQFYNYLGLGVFASSPLRMSHIQVFSTENGKLLGSSTLPCQLGLHVNAYLLDDGVHLLLTCQSNSPKLSEYFVAKSASPQDQRNLASLMIPLTILNTRTGQTIKEWPGLGWCSVDRIDDHYYFHRTSDAEPVLQWASSRPYRKPHFRVLNSKTLALIELESPTGAMVESVISDRDGFLMHSFKNVQDIKKPNVTTTTIFVTSFDNTGAKLSESSLQMNGVQAHLIHAQRQLILSQGILMPWHEAWWNWTKRWPWLKSLHRSYSNRIWVWDMDTGENHLVTTSKLNMYEATLDGKYLLVGKANSDDRTTELSVYALPFPPLRWWAIWVPRLAGVLAVFLVFYMVMKALPGSRKSRACER